MTNKALEAFKRIETSLRSHLQDTWHSTCKAEDDLNLVRAALAEAPSANIISLTAFNEIKEKLGKAAYIFGTHFAEGDATGEYNDALIALNESILQLNAITEAPRPYIIDEDGNMSQEEKRAFTDYLKQPPNQIEFIPEAPKVDMSDAAILADIKNEAFFFAMKQVKGMANRKHAQFSSATADYFITHYDLVKKEG